VFVGPIWAQRPLDVRSHSPFHPDDSITAEALLRNAARQAEQSQWVEAIDLYERAIAQHGDSLARVALAPQAAVRATLYVNVRAYVQAALARLPAEGLAEYRRRVDAPAAELLERGLGGDSDALRRIIEDYFVSSVGDQALDLLGDLAFREGRYGLALSCYRALVPAGEVAAGQAVYPDPDVDRARVAAKILLCQAALGEPPSEDDLAAFRATYPEARGRLAGREGSLSEIVAAALAEDRLAARPTIRNDWPTLGGSSTRGGVAPEPIDIGSLQWRVPLQPRRTEPDGRTAGNAAARSSPDAESLEPLTHPILVGGLVIVAGDDRVTAYRLGAMPDESDEAQVRRAVLAWEQRLPGLRQSSTRGQPTVNPQPRTLTASGDRIIARLGDGRAGGELLAIRSNPEVEGKLLWKKKAGEVGLPTRLQRAADRGFTAFEGTPVADERRIYVALTELGPETDLYAACLDAETGQTRWVRYLGTANPEPDRTRLAAGAAHRLLTLDGERLYYQTNLGALVCLDAPSGAIRWLATYPTRDRLGAPELRRTPNPAVVHGGRVFIAPTDAAEILAFDAASGQPLWATPPIPRAHHLLGVASGRLYATGDRIYSIDPASGRVVRVWPEYGGYEGYGRGLLAGDRVYWPTRTDILVVDQATGGDVHQVIPLWQLYGRGGGNLAASEGYLAIAERESLVIYGQSCAVMERRREQVVAAPDNGVLRFRLARLEESAGELEAALASYEEAARRAQPGDLVDGKTVSQAVRERVFEVLMALGRKASNAGDFQTAVAWYLRARDAADTNRRQLAARVALSEAQAASGALEQSVAELQAILADPGLGDQLLELDEGRRVRADLFATQRLREAIVAHGPEIYAVPERQAEHARAEALRANDPRALLAVAAVYPLSTAAREVPRQAAELAERLGRLRDAAAAYSLWLHDAPPGPERACALVGLARAYAAMGYDTLARDVGRRALEAYADLDLRPFGLDGTVASLLASVGASGREPVDLFALPLEPAWSRDLPSGRRVGELASDDTVAAGLLVPVIEGRWLEALDARTGKPLWSRELPDEFSWVDQDEDRLLVAGLRQVVALGLHSGEIQWVYDPASEASTARRPDPFARPLGGEPVETEPRRAVGRLHGFRRLGSRLYALRGDRELLALDTRSGRVAWSFRPPVEDRRGGSGDGLNPFWALTADRVVVQFGVNRTIAAFDPQTGALMERIDRGIAEAPWCADPVPIEPGRILVAPDPHTLTLIDLVRRADVWTYRADSPLPWSTPPQTRVRDGLLLSLLGGQELHRLDPRDGRPLWRRRLGLVDLSHGAETLALDDDRLYVAQPGRIVAYRLADGEPAWTRRLPDEGHATAVRLVGPFLLAYSRPGLGSSGPLGSTAVLLCRRDDGSPSQSIPLRGPIRDLTVRATADRLVVSTQSALEVWIRPPGDAQAP
jgi:outer membrane protein assembly factor BamB